MGGIVRYYDPDEALTRTDTCLMEGLWAYNDTQALIPVSAWVLNKHD
jgi:hypothetical protein